MEQVLLQKQFYTATIYNPEKMVVSTQLTEKILQW